MITIRAPEDPLEARPALRLLRDQILEEVFDRRLEAAITGGYRTIVADKDGAVVAALGYRILDDLCWGRTLFVDDLVVAEPLRGQKIGARLLKAAGQAAAERGCDCIRLCSGHRRKDAHRFYEAHGMTASSLQFVTKDFEG